MSDSSWSWTPCMVWLGKWGLWNTKRSPEDNKLVLREFSGFRQFLQKWNNKGDLKTFIMNISRRVIKGMRVYFSFSKYWTLSGIKVLEFWTFRSPFLCFLRISSLCRSRTSCVFQRQVTFPLQSSLELHKSYSEDNITTNKTGSNVAARFPLYPATCEHEIAAHDLWEGWFLVSRCSSSHLRLFFCTIYFILERLDSCADFWNSCFESLTHYTLESSIAGGTGWAFQEEAAEHNWKLRRQVIGST